MGNCQTAEAATVVIQHAEGKVERVYWSLRASQVMAANPGHYVAAVIANSSSSSSANSNCSRRKAENPVKHLKLLRPDDTLHIGHVYRLVSFEEVLREFASKKHVKLSRLLAKQAAQKPSRPRRRTSSSGGCSASGRDRITTTSSASEEKPKQQQKGVEEEEKASAAAAARVEAELEEAMQRLMAVGSGNSSGSGGKTSRAPYRHHTHWRPALESIAEAGSTSAT